MFVSDRGLGLEGGLSEPGWYVRLTSSACGRLGGSGASAVDGDHQLRSHGVVLVVAHAAVGEGSPNRDHALLPEAPEDEHHVAGQRRVRGEDMPL